MTEIIVYCGWRFIFLAKEMVLGYLSGKTFTMLLNMRDVTVFFVNNQLGIVPEGDGVFYRERVNHLKMVRHEIIRSVLKTKNMKEKPNGIR